MKEYWEHLSWLSGSKWRKTNYWLKISNLTTVNCKVSEICSILMVLDYYCMLSSPLCRGLFLVPPNAILCIWSSIKLVLGTGVKCIDSKEYVVEEKSHCVSFPRFIFKEWRNKDLKFLVRNWSNIKIRRFSLSNLLYCLQSFQLHVTETTPKVILRRQYVGSHKLRELQSCY